jgi:glycosyltransferase involved in cell wall biosynthesis
MACGLPIVSSNLPCNDDILNESNSIRINSRNIKEIVEAITRIRDDLNLRNSMAVASLSKVEKHKISRRTSKIIEFIKNRL